MRARPQILMDVIMGALTALGNKAAEDGEYEQFAVDLQKQGVYDMFAEQSEVLEARLAGQPCPGCNDEPGAVCNLCGWNPVQLPPPGWYADPEHDGYRRYWTGQCWSGIPVEMTVEDDVEVNGTYEPTGWNA